MPILTLNVIVLPNYNVTNVLSIIAKHAAPKKEESSDDEFSTDDDSSDDEVRKV